MSDNFFKVKNGLNLPNYTGGSFPTLSNPAAGDLVFYNNALYVYNGTAWVIKPGSGSTGLITNADVSSVVGDRIDGGKITPDFGAQNILTSGTITANGVSSKLTVTSNTVSETLFVTNSGGPAAYLSGNVAVANGNITVDTAKGIESSTAASTLNIGTGSNTTTLNLGTGSSTQTVNIGTGAGVTTINIGATGDTVVVAGTLTTVNTTNLDVADKNITLNKGGLAGSANGSGISIEAGGSSVASLSFDQTDSGAQPQNTFTLSGTGSLALPAGTTAQRPNTPANGMVRYNSDNGAFEGYASGAWSGIGGGGTVDRITQASHGFVVGDVLYINGGNYAKARADVAATAEVVGMVSRVIDASNFEMTLNGEVSGLTGLTMGENYFLSAATAGAITATEPSVVGQISLPIGVASSTTTLYVAPKRGATIGGANVRTSITLTNNATTNVQNASAYEAGELAGWVFIDGTTDYRFYVQAQFARNGLGNNYNLSYQTTGDTPPAGFSMGITAAGVITATLPSVTGYATASINFALNAPAVGATLPLQISGGNVTGPVLGSTSGASAAGYVGEFRTAGNDANGVVSGTTRNVGTLTSLTPGIYLMWATVGTDFSSTNPNITKLEVSLSTTSATHNMTYKSSFPVPSTVANGFGKVSTAPALIVITTPTTWYGVGTITASGNVDYQYTSLNAVRIA